MDRRKFLKTAGVGAVAASTLAAPAIAKGVKQLKMVTSWPKNFPGLGTAAARIAQRIEAMSDGRFKVRVYAGGELVHPLKCLDAVQEGTADLYHSAEYYYQGKDKGFAFYAAVPFGFTATEISAAPRSCGTSWPRTSASSPSRAATPACRWAAGSANP